MKEIKTLASIPIGQICEIVELGGKWRVTRDNGSTVTVENTRSSTELTLDKKTQLK